ncbi:MAG: hypothetical protein ACYDH3_11025 [Candidatus Aminicenantales bacterium]
MNAMQLFFYSSGNDPNAKRLEASVQQVIPKRRIELYAKLDDLEARLRMPVEPDSIAVLSVSNREELQKIQALRQMLPEIYVVLVLPDRKKRTLALAHLLLPRFLSRKESDFEDLKIVLHKMYLHTQSSQPGELFLES